MSALSTFWNFWLVKTIQWESFVFGFSTGKVHSTCGKKVKRNRKKILKRNTHQQTYIYASVSFGVCIIHEEWNFSSGSYMKLALPGPVLFMNTRWGSKHKIWDGSSQEESVRPRQVKRYCLLMRKAELLFTPWNPYFVFTFVLRFSVCILELTNVALIHETGWDSEDIKRACWHDRLQDWGFG